MPKVAGEPSQTVNISAAASIQVNRDKSIEAGKLVRAADQVLAQQADTLQSMNDNLQAIVKQYPPFRTDDPARAQYLESFSGLRKQMEALQVPKLDSGQDVLPKEIRFPTEHQGLGIPNLDPASASDAQVAAASRQVEAAIAKVSDQREALASGVSQVLGGTGYTDLLKQLG